MPVMTMRPTVRPMNGATTMKIRVFVQPDTMTAPNPALATAAPAYPPNRACEELVGKPKYHVIRFHAMAARRPGRITAKVTADSSTMPEPTVVATPVPNQNTASTLNTDAQTTACAGDSTRVDTTVAIEFAAS